MKLAVVLAVPIVMSAWASAVSANEAYALAKKSRCTMCHLKTSRIAAPSFQQISERYRNDPAARDMLIGKIKNGGSGAWGALAMPANYPRVSEEDIVKLVDSLLAKDEQLAMSE